MASRQALRQLCSHLSTRGCSSSCSGALWCQHFQAGARCFSAGAPLPKGRDIYAPDPPARAAFGKALALLIPASMAGVLAWGFSNPDDQRIFSATSPRQVAVSGEELVNWSATHSVKPKHFYQPENQDDVEAIVADCAANKRRLRVVGSGLSPNGVGFSGEGMLSMALLDKVLWVDPDSQLVRVEAGCRVQQVADALKPYGLSLQNYASIREQQIGGFTQVSAHGTGATIPPVDEQVVSLKLVTPAGGVLEVNAANDPELFSMAKVGLGCLGVVTELTLKAVPMQKLRERTFVASAKDVSRHHASWLRSNKHLRYMWIPYTDSVVVVQVNPEGPPAVPSLPQQQQQQQQQGGSSAGGVQQQAGSATQSAYGDIVQEETVSDSVLAQRLAPLRSLLLSASAGLSEADVAGLSATELRDALLVLNPLDRDWVARVNQAEAEFWKRSAGQRVGYADQILGFDCGGQQWVLEVAFPIGSYSQVTSSWRAPNRDIACMQELLRIIEAAAVPAPAPIEQRWTAASSSSMSPAAAGRLAAAGSSCSSSRLPADSVFSWVGIIMYLPSEDPQQRQAITNRFVEYAGLVQDKLMPAYGATWHWAKIEPPADNPQRLAAMRAALAARFPLDRFNAQRARLDPDNILGNVLLDELIGTPASA